MTRNVFEEHREQVRALMQTEAFERSAQERKKIEMRFAHLKRHLGFRRLRLRGLTAESPSQLISNGTADWTTASGGEPSFGRSAPMAWRRQERTLSKVLNGHQLVRSTNTVGDSAHFDIRPYN